MMETKEDFVNIPTDLRQVKFTTSGELFNKDLLEQNIETQKQQLMMKVLLVGLLGFAWSVI